MGIMEVPLAAASAAVEGSGYGHHMWYGEGHGGFMGPFAMVVLLLVAVVVAVLLIRWLGATHPSAATGRQPLDILQERFARGEIDKEEYEERRRVLGG